MMSAIKYLKLDYRLVKSSLNMSYVLFLLIVGVFFFTRPTFGINYLFFFMIIFATMPFQLTKTDHCEMLYALMPARKSDQVLGRMLFLASLYGGTVLLVALSGAVMFLSGRIGNMEIVNIMLIGSMAGLIPLMQYPLYYRFGIGKARTLSMLVYIVPAMVLLSLSSIYELANGEGQFLLTMFNLVIEHPMSYIMISLGMIGVASVLSFRISHKILLTRPLDPEGEDAGLPIGGDLRSIFRRNREA